MKRRPPQATGLTLIELLVIIAIIGILTVATVPIVAPVIASTKLREGARSVSTALRTASARAAESRRPYGVLFQPLGGSRNMAMDLYYVEVPPPFAGLEIGHKITLTSVNTAARTATIAFDPEILDADSNPNWGYYVSEGDVLKINYQGHQYLIENISDATVTFSSETSLSVPPSVPAPGLPFQVFRQPVKSSVLPPKLPERVCVDVVLSGVGDGTFNVDTRTIGGNINVPFMVLFAPSGQIDKVYSFDGTDTLVGYEVTDAVHFLIRGTEDYINAADDVDNLENLNSMWVSVGYQSGQITTAPNAPCDEGGTVEADCSNLAVPADEMYHRRRFARDGQGTGGL